MDKRLAILAVVPFLACSKPKPTAQETSAYCALVFQWWSSDTTQAGRKALVDRAATEGFKVWLDTSEVQPGVKSANPVLRCAPR